MRIFIDCNVPMYVAGTPHHSGTNHDLEWIASFDHGFDRVAGIRRLEPG